MAIQRGKDLLAKPDATSKEIDMSISALRLDSEHVRKCVSAGLREGDSGREVMKEIADLIKKLEAKKLKCTN